MKILAFSICLLGALAVGCAHRHEGKVDAPADSLQGLVGQRVILVGIAEPRKLGAALRGEDFYVWVEKLHDWPTGYVDQKVQIDGILEVRHDLPVFIPKTGERQPQGIPMPAGTDLPVASARYVVRDATWKVIR